MGEGALGAVRWGRKGLGVSLAHGNFPLASNGSEAGEGLQCPALTGPHSSLAEPQKGPQKRSGSPPASVCPSQFSQLGKEVTHRVCW